jgi:hypothetical protein
MERSVYETTGCEVIRLHHMLQNYGYHIEGKVNEAGHAIIAVRWWSDPWPVSQSVDSFVSEPILLKSSRLA